MKVYQLGRFPPVYALVGMDKWSFLAGLIAHYAAGALIQVTK
jgi:hypothetical protein